MTGPRRHWLWTVSAATAVALGLLAIVAMSVLEHRADDQIAAACARLGRSGEVRWRHGFPMALPIAALALPVGAVALSLVSIIRRDRHLPFQLLGGALILVSVPMIMLAGLLLVDFLSFPGPDISSTMPPCGEG